MYYEINNMKFYNYQNWDRDLLFARCIFPSIRKFQRKSFNNIIHHNYKYVIINFLIAQGFYQYLAQHIFEFLEYENNKKKFNQCLWRLYNNYDDFKLKLKPIDLESIYYRLESDHLN